MAFNTPDYEFSNLQWGEKYNAFNGVVTEDAISQSKYAVEVRIVRGRVVFTLVLTRALVKVLGPYAKVTARDGQPAVYEYAIGKGETILLEPPPFRGTITILHNTRPS